MKSDNIEQGKIYQNGRGIHRKVESITEDPELPGARNRRLTWVMTRDRPEHRKGRTPEASGTCRVSEFAYWAQGEVTMSDDQVQVQDLNPTLEGSVLEMARDLETWTPAGANDLVAAYVVILTKETKGKDLEATVGALQQIKGVGTVTPLRADMQHFIARDQARRELLTQLRDVLNPKV